MNDTMSVADVMALQNSRQGQGMFGDGNNMIWLLFILFLFAGGNGFGGFGGNNAAAQQLSNDFLYSNMTSQLNQGFNQNQAALRDLGNGLCNLGYTTSQQFNGLERQLADCCCATQRSIDRVSYEGAQNTCAITNAIHADGEATRALINANMMQELRDNNANLRMELQNAQNSIINTAQTQTLLGALRPQPMPAYITCSPYTTNVPMC